MPLLSNLVLFLGNVLMRFFLKFFDRKVAWIFACFTLMAGLLSTLYFSVKACIASCVPTLGGMGGAAEYFRMGLGLAFNGVTAVSISCWIAVATACSLYVWKKKLLDVIIRAF